MRTIIVPDYETMSGVAANEVAIQMLKKNNLCLGLATGSTPVGMYQVLVQFFKDRFIDFSKIKTVNLDEYIGLEPDHEQSYALFMKEHLFSHVNCTNYNLPNGKAENLEEECSRYDSVASNIDLQILGIGANGHIGFNEPSDTWTEGTCVADLTTQTISDNARKYFDGDMELVPKTAISMGIKQIMESKQIILIANGKEKAQAIFNMINGPVTPQCPASILQQHPNVTVIIDKEAAQKLH